MYPTRRHNWYKTVLGCFITLEVYGGGYDMRDAGQVDLAMSRRWRVFSSSIFEKSNPKLFLNQSLTRALSVVFRTSFAIVVDKSLLSTMWK